MRSMEGTRIAASFGSPLSTVVVNDEAVLVESDLGLVADRLACQGGPCGSGGRRRRRRKTNLVAPSGFALTVHCRVSRGDGLDSRRRELEVSGDRSNLTSEVFVSC